jgi:hypothetical protein
VAQSDRETAKQIDRRCDKQMRETQEKLERIAAQEKRGPRTLKEMEKDGTTRRFP